jgi:stage V sporulation protein D (sporulation-specific penicillin-binding protein)
LVDREDYLDVPIYVKTSWEVNLAKSFQRQDPTLQKYIAKNVYWPWVLRDKNISMPYEPWSIFKAFTVAIGFDIDEIRPYDFYNDPWFVKVWPYEINNVDDACLWDNSFLHAFIYSCNVWMVRIAQTVWKETFYNYLDKLAFGKPTWIELGWEEEWSVEGVTTVSLARYLNNAFWQWLLVTPLQIAVWYSTLVNWWYYVQPTIVAGIYDKQTATFRPKTRKVVRQIFKPETSEMMKDAMFQVMEQNPEVWKDSKVEWFALWWKTWTSQISYKWKYMNWNWWTNASFVGLITKNNLKYMVVVQVRRPRSSIWWWFTAWKVFGDVARFLIWYNLIEK